MPHTTTAHLLSLDKKGLTAATEHPWLRLIGQGKLSKDDQLAWLKQDRLYALSYVSFIGGILAKVSIPTTANRTSTLEWRIADVLIEALIGIKRELGMFEDILRDAFDWGASGEEDIEPAPPTKLYQKLFEDASSPSTSLVVGLTALWATERCYLEAWKYARQQHEQSKTGSIEKDVVRQTLIPNWTSPEFKGFVDSLGDLVDEYAASSDAAQKQLPELEAVWRRILDVERQFWPNVVE